MKKKIKKIITTTVISAVSLTAIGCAANNKISCGSENCKNISSCSMKLETMKTTSAKAPTTARNIGKIIETSTNENGINIYNTKNGLAYLNENFSESNIENTLASKNEKFNLFILSNTPYISLTSDDNNSMNLNIKFTKSPTVETSSETKNQNSSYDLKRSILMVYVNELNNGNISLSNENKTLINTHLESINNNSTDTKAIDSIISILESNLTSNSKFYNSNLSESYNNLIFNFNKSQTVEKITEYSTNEQIASKIACTFNFCNLNDGDKIEQSTNNNINQVQKSKSLTNTQNNQNNNSAYQNNSSTNQATNSNDNRYNRIPNSVRHRRMHNQNNAINSSSLDIKQDEYKINSNQNNLNRNQNLNNSRSIMENSKTLRAERSPENLSNEEYSTTTSSNFTNEPRATRVPYSTQSNNFQR